VYSEDLETMKKWKNDDKFDYITVMEQTLGTFFKGGNSA
jgi:hypothetical protein